MGVVTIGLRDISPHHPPRGFVKLWVECLSNVNPLGREIYLSMTKNETFLEPTQTLL